MTTAKKRRWRPVSQQELTAMNQLADTLMANECLARHPKYDIYCQLEAGHDCSHYATANNSKKGYKWRDEE